MPCNKPKRQVSGGKKFVVKACQGGKEKIIRFGDAKMTIKKSNPARKKSYCARSGGIKGKKNKLSANYWSRRAGTVEMIWALYMMAVMPNGVPVQLRNIEEFETRKQCQEVAAVKAPTVAQNLADASGMPIRFCGSVSKKSAKGVSL